uniref:Tumor protein p53 binding protein, 1 n=1 Tax=Poecilia latipinna TaxID=48699 RepID=A0A3B3TP00_9TELE
MDPGGSELDSSLPQPENPCLIVEDSQPDSVGLEDDPESSYRALLARRLSSLQPAARSPVLELISSPPGSRCSQIDSQSESNNQAEPEVVAAADPSSPLQEESQVINVCPHPTKKKFVPEDSEMDPGADSTTNCVQSDGGSSQFGFLELSQSQDLEAGGDPGHRSEKQQSVALKTLAHQDNKAVRSEVSSSSSSESVGQSGRQLTVQVLLHSQNLQESEEPDQQDCDVLSSQEDLFDADKSGAAVDSTVSEPEQPARPTSTPAHSLQLLHLSGQGTLVQESLSQSSVDYVAPTPDNFPHTPLIIPSSPTEAENERDEEPMDTSLPPEERAAAQDEPMETDAASRPHSPTSAPVSQNASGPERALPVPSQPGLSHDVFVPTQSQEARKSPPLPSETQSSLRESAPFSPALQLSVNADSGDPVPVEEDSQDSQDTQIDELEEPPGVDTSDAVAPEESQQPDRTEPDLPHESDRQQQEAETNVNESSNANHSDLAANSCVQETPCSTTAASHASSSGETAEQNHSTDKNKMDDCEEEEEDVMKEENTGGASAMALVLSESQLMSPEPMEEEIQDSVVVATDGEKDRNLQPESSVSEGDGAKGVATANGHRQQTQEERAEDALGGREMEGVKDKSLSDSSGDISFHFTLPKEGELIGPAVGSTPPPVSQLKQTLRHSTPIEITPFSEKPCGAGDDAAEAAADGEDGKLSLRMKLVTPVEEGGSERFSLQKPALSEEEEESVAAVTTVSTAVTSPSVFTRVRQAHRQQGAEEDPGNNAVIRGKLFASPQRSSQVSPLGCNSLPNSQSEPSQPDVSSAPQNNLKDAGVPAEPAGKRREPAEAPDLRPPTGVEGGQKEAQKTPDGPNAATPSSKARQRIASQQPGVDGLGPRSPGGRGEPETPSFRRTAAPAHRRHVRTIQEVRTTVTRIITDVYYEDGREVDRRVTEESEEPVVDCQVLDSDISPCRTGSSSVTSGDLGDISSLSSKASSLHHSSGGTSGSTGPSRPDFVMPPSRGFRSVRGGGAGPLQRLGALAQTHSFSEDEPFACMLPPRLPASPSDADPPGRSDSLRSSPEAAPSAGSSFVGLRVVAKWSSNGYFYSGRIVKDAGDSRFRLRFDDGYECEVAGKDILLCDPIPLETEVTALLEDEYFSIGVIKGHKTEGQDLFYSVEKDGQRQWHNRTAVILSLDQGNKLREQHSLGPYEPTTPLTKASDISLDNLVEGKRRRRGTPGGANTPSRSSSGGARTPGPSGKRKLVPSEENKTPSKRGRRGGGARAGCFKGFDS